MQEASYTSKRPSEGLQLHQGENMYVYECVCVCGRV